MRALILSFLLILLVLQYRLWLAEDGVREVWRMQEEVIAQTAANERQASLNGSLEAEVLDLKEGTAAVEERARADLGLIRPDETFFQLAPKSD